MRLIGFSVVVSLALAATCANAAYLDIPLPLPPSLGGTGNANGPSASAYAFSTTGGPAVLTSANLAAPVVIVTGTLTSSTTLTLPLGLAGVWTFINETSGAYPLYVGVVGQAAPLAVPQGYARQISSDGTNASSPVAQAYALTTPTTTTTGDVPAWGGLNGQSLTDSGYAIGTNGGSLCPVNGACVWSGYQTFSGGTNLPQGIGSMLINGDMDIDQAYEGGANGSGIDRWAYSFTSGSGMAFQRVQDAPIAYAHSLKVSAPTSAVTVGASDIRVLRQPVEGSMVEPLAWGTSQGQAATFTFQAKCSATGTYSYSLNNSSSSYSYVGTYSISTAGAWTPVSATIPAPPSGSPWATFNANQFSLQIRFDLGSGSTYATSTTGAWQSGHYETVTGAIELIAQTNGYCEFAAVHLQPGSIGGGYLPRAYGEELALARRYYSKTFPEGTAPAQNAGVAGALCARAQVASAYVSVYFSLPTGLYTGSGSSPSVTTFNPSNTNANFRDVTGSADVTAIADPASAKSGTGVEIATSATVTTAGHEVCIHAVFDSGFH